MDPIICSSCEGDLTEKEISYGETVCTDCQREEAERSLNSMGMPIDETPASFHP